ncbi:MAG: TIGR01777 family oxidoreductase [Bacteroidota bacterium]
MINKIVIAGGNGFLGTVLYEYFAQHAKEVIVIARKKMPERGNLKSVLWDGKNIGDWSTTLEGADVLINLAGKNVNCRYTEENKKLIYSSRLDSTHVLGRALQQCQNPPKLWINMSSATIYNASFDRYQTEASDDVGDDFSMDVCKQWETAFNKYHNARTRKALIRTSIVLGNDGGALPVLKNLVKVGMGSRQGDGRQFCSWIHERDFCRVIQWIISNSSASGIYNVVAPQPVINSELMCKLRRAMNKSWALPMPQWLLELGAVLIGTETELILKSRKVYPKRLLDEGFVFEFSDAEHALEDLCQNVKNQS